VPQGAPDRKDLGTCACGTAAARARDGPEARKHMSGQGKSNDRATRTKRRADALRENLRRRKLQARSRNATSAKDAAKEATKAVPGGPEEQSGPASDKR
jgi:hypothetical protein